MTRFVDFNGEILTDSEAVIPADSAAVAYGEGCFATFVAVEGKYLRLNSHLERIRTGMRYIGMDDAAFDEGSVRKRLRILLSKNNLDNDCARIRIQAGSLLKPGEKKDGKTPYFSLITARPAIDNPESVRLAETVFRKTPSVSLRQDVKWSQYLANMMAVKQAREAGCDDVVLLNTRGFISETAIANIFWTVGTTVYTPGQDCDILPGVTRSVVLDALEEDGFLVRAGHFTFNVLEKAGHVFLTNAVRGITPVSAVGQRKYQIHGPVLDKIMNLFESRKSRELC